MSYLVDSHCHLHDREFFTPRQAQEMLGRAFSRNVQRIICIGTSHRDSLEARKFITTNKALLWTYGIHPENASSPTAMMFGRQSMPNNESTAQPLSGQEDAQSSKEQTANLSKDTNNPTKPSLTEVLEAAEYENAFLRLFPDNPPIAIGEVGLDYHYGASEREAQIKLFEKMLQLAKNNGLPVSFHIREAFEDFFAIVENFPGTRGVVHSFSDNKKNLKKILEDTDFYVGVNGLATYSTLPTPPLERILLETDAPFLTPKPFRGIINEPGYVSFVADWLAGKLGLEPKIIELETTKNARELYVFQDPEAS